LHLISDDKLHETYRFRELPPGAPPGGAMTDVLIIKPSSLGDIVHALQVATSLKAQVSHLRISWVVREIFAPIVRACEAVDRVYVFERNAGAKGFLRLTKELRKTKFEYVFKKFEF